MPRCFVPITFMIVVIIGCTHDDHPIDLPEGPLDQPAAEDADSTIQHCDSVAVASWHGTACCVSGPILATPGDTLKYHYQMNLRDAQVTWEILDGDLAIIAGQGTHTVTVRVGPTFTNGIVFASGLGIKYDDSPRLRCTDRVIIQRR